MSSPNPSDSRSQVLLNIDRNHRLQLSNASSSYSTISTANPSRYPSIPRFTSATPSRLSGNYTPPTAGNSYNGHTHGRRGTRSTSSSPPGTPPSGLRSYYLNAALQRSQHHFYAAGSAPGSSASLQRPNLSIVIPTPTSGIQVPEPTVIARRSYSVDQLKVDEPEITVTTPGGTNSAETVSHAISLRRALSNLIESEGREGEQDETKEGDGEQTDGPVMMRTSKPQQTSSSSSSSATPPGTPSHRKEQSKHPKVVFGPGPDNRHKGSSIAAGTLVHGVGESDVTLTMTSTAEASEMAKNESKRRFSDLHGYSNRISRLFHRDEHVSQYDQGHTASSTDPARQPSRAGVLSNLLKLHGHGHGRQHKNTASRPHGSKEKKPKRPKMYSRSANNSTTSLNTKSLFGTYPPLPATPSQPTTTVSLSNFQPNPRSPNRLSRQFDGYFTQSFSAMNSPFQSPNGTPRESFSAGERTPNGAPFNFEVVSGTSGSGGGSSSSTHHPALSHEEKLRITVAVADILERQDYILRLAKSMIKYGAPSHRLEDAIDHSARTLEINLQCVYLPNMMIVAFTDYETHTSETHLLKVSAGLDMYKCALVHQVHKMVTHSSMPVEEAIMKLDAINAEKDANSRWMTVLAYAVASFCTASMFFKGSWIDAGVSFLMGGAVGLLVWLSEKVPSYAHICEITMSVVVAFVAEALSHKTSVCQSAVKMAGIVIILPGYTITCAILELSSRHIISGSVRLFYAVVFSLLLGYGLTIGSSIWTLIDSSSGNDEKITTGCPSGTLDPKWNILFVPLFAISLNIWLKAHPRQWPLAIVLSIVGYTVSYTSSTYAGAQTEVSSALAAFAIGFLGNVYQRLTRQLSFQAVVCAVFFLVPGSMGLKGAMSLFIDNMTEGVNFALQMVLTAIAISVGLFASALVVYPMGKTRSAQMTF
ncbi:hypothetical protein BGX31_001665 [Mortierella sp. GBA43]|nr:hypothetical protein BGX31_001665 [Mortierella sp. GBA43]